MQKILLSQAEPGMVLTRDLYRDDATSGIPVCGKGTELTGEMISRFQRMDIRSLYVNGADGSGDAPSCEEQLRALARRFERVQHDPLMNMIHDVFANSIKRSRGEASGG